jgi:hypothetical protein
MVDLMEELRKDEQEVQREVLEFLQLFKIEDRLKGVPAEERLKRVPAEERLKGVPTEERLKGLPAEELLKHLPAEERLKGLSLEEILKAIPPEIQALLKEKLKDAAPIIQPSLEKH